MRRSLPGALLAAALAALLAGLGACSFQEDPVLVTLEVTGKRNAPADASWAAFGDPTGAWHPLAASAPGTYRVRPDGHGRYSIAIGCASDPPTVTVFHGTASESLTLSAKCEAEDEGGCGSEALAPTAAVPLDVASPAGSLLPQAGALLYTIDVAGLPAGERAFAYFHGDPLALDEAMGQVNVSMGRDNVLFFTLVGPENAGRAGTPDPNAVTGWTWTTASSGQPAVHIVASGEGSNVTAPDHAGATVLRANGDAVTTKATLKLPHAVRVPLGSAKGESLSYHSVPAALADATEEGATMLSATALGQLDAAGDRNVRGVQMALPLGDTADATLALAGTALTGAERLADGTVRFARYRDPALGPALAYQLTSEMGPAGAPTLVWRAAFTPGWLAASGQTEGSATYRFPDLSTVVDAAWLPPADAQGTWQVDALLGRTSNGDDLDVATILGGHGPEKPGMTLWSAGRSGPL